MKGGQTIRLLPSPGRGLRAALNLDPKSGLDSQIQERPEAEGRQAGMCLDVCVLIWGGLPGYEALQLPVPVKAQYVSLNQAKLSVPKNGKMYARGLEPGKGCFL